MAKRSRSKSDNEQSTRGEYIDKVVTPDSTPHADWPSPLQRLSNQLALSGEVDATNPAATMQEAYIQVVAISLRHMHEAVEHINDDVRALKALDGPQPPS